MIILVRLLFCKFLNINMKEFLKNNFYWLLGLISMFFVLPITWRIYKIFWSNIEFFKFVSACDFRLGGGSLNLCLNFINPLSLIISFILMFGFFYFLSKIISKYFSLKFKFPKIIFLIFSFLFFIIPFFMIILNIVSY